MKILTIIGARPQFIKAAAVSHVFAQHEALEEILLHTGQHFDDNMSDIFFNELHIPKPIYNLGIGGGLHGAMTGAQLAGIEQALLEVKPAWVLVYGDTNSTLAGALAAAKLHIPIAHVEAGLRSFNRKMPEEINRIITDQISTALFAPTLTAMHHLSAEGIPAEQCHQVGDVMYDATLLFSQIAQQKAKIIQQLELTNESYILVTIHRAENTDDLQRLRTIILGLNELSKTIPIIWPIHPRTRKILEKSELTRIIHKEIKLITPVGYLDMLQLEQNASVITTDSGGVQKEAFFHQVPCVTLRNETEWIELVESGWNQLVNSTNPETIAATILRAKSRTGQPIEPYGQGDAALRICNHFRRFL